MTDMDFTLDERVIRKPTHDTPEAALAAAVEAAHRLYYPVGELELNATAAAILAAMPDWVLMPRVATADWTGSTRKDATIVRLRTAIQAVLDDAESQHPGGWGPDVTTVAFLRAALAGGDDDE